MSSSETRIVTGRMRSPLASLIDKVLGLTDVITGLLSLTSSIVTVTSMSATCGVVPLSENILYQIA